MTAARGHATATLGEAAVGIVPVGIAVDRSVQAAWAGAALAGPAYTVQAAGGDNLALHHAVAEAPAGSVLVVDAAGAPFGHWGEVLAVAAQVRGIVGLVIDGGVRDRAELAALGFPVFSRNDSIRGTRKDFAGVLGRAVTIGGVRVDSGDLVVGDADGVVAVPDGYVSGVLDSADERVEKERGFLEAIRAGASTLELYGFGAARV